MNLVMARGPNFVYAKEFVRQEYGDDVWRQILERLPATAAPIWSKQILLTDSQPFAAFKAMPVALAEVVGTPAERETARMYAFIADRSLNSIYKFFFRFAEPSFVISRYPVLWGRFFESGRVSVPMAEQSKARLDFEIEEIFLDWLRPACLGYSQKAVELSGGRDVRLHDRESEHVSDDVWLVSYDLTWSE